MLFLACLVAVGAQPSDRAAKKKPAVDAAKKIADSTPPALPQSPKEQRPQTDAQFENLKGKIKSIVYRIDDDENPSYPRRMLTREEFYAEDGDLVRAVDYDDVHPRAVTVFGYIDGLRVSNSRSVDYAAGEEKPAGRYDVVTLAVDPAAKPATQPRYDTRYLRRYDKEGRLAEERFVSGTGETRVRTVHKYETPNRRHLYHYAADAGEPLARTTEVLDTAGNIVEVWFYDEDGKMNAVHSHTYEFDARGNWIVRKTIEKTTLNRVPVQRSISTTYRTITYY